MEYLKVGIVMMITVIVIGVIVIVVIAKFYAKEDKKTKKRSRKKTWKLDDWRDWIVAKVKNLFKGVKKGKKEEKKSVWSSWNITVSVVSIGVIVWVFKFYVQWEILLLIGLIIVFVLLFSYILLFVLAKSNTPVTFPTEGEVTVIMTGKKVKRMILISGEYYPDEDDGWKIKPFSRKYTKEQHEAKKSWLNKTFGVYWVGWPPYSYVLTYKFAWAKAVSEEIAKVLAEEKDQKGIIAIEELPFAGVSLLHREEVVDSMFLYFTYPVLIKNVELRGNITIDILLHVIVRAYDPYKAVIELKGNWFLTLVDAIKGVTADITRDEDFESFQKLEKSKESKAKQSKGEKQLDEIGKLHKKIMEITTGKLSDDEQDTLFAEEIKEGVKDKGKDEIGIDVVKVIYVAFGISKDADKAIKDAITAKQVNKLVADGVREKADGEADATIKKGIAEERVIDMLYKKARGSGDDGLATLRTQFLTNALEKTNVNVLSFDPSKIIVSVPADKKPKKQNDK